MPSYTTRGRARADIPELGKAIGFFVLVIVIGAAYRYRHVLLIAALVVLAVAVLAVAGFTGLVYLIGRRKRRQFAARAVLEDQDAALPDPVSSPETVAWVYGASVRVPCPANDRAKRELS